MIDVRPALAAAPDLADAVRGLSRSSALVIGDATLDRYIHGQFLDTDGDPLLIEETEVALPGGAGNLVRNLTALGAAVAFIAVVGDDQAGSDLTGLIGGQPHVEPWLLVEGGRTTTVATRYVGSGRSLLRSLREETAAISERLAERVLRIARDAAAATAVTVLSDHGNGLLAGTLPARLIAAARKSGRPVVAVPKGPDHARFSGADVIMVSEFDLTHVCGRAVQTEGDAGLAATALRQRHGFGAVLTLRAGRGMTLAGPDGVSHLADGGLSAGDISVASDAAVATLACALGSKLDLRVCARLAGIAADAAAAGTAARVARQEDLLAAVPPGQATSIGA
jgi:D-beta-D-heptose 7-phosphate kinase/D-beta-D-heptose 1-phosphate adenosyltransferase